MITVFYELPADELREGVSTDDGQDVLRVRIFGTHVHAAVYTPLPDDPEVDEERRNSPETRIYPCGSLVSLAVFADTATDLSRHPQAQNRRAGT